MSLITTLTPKPELSAAGTIHCSKYFCRNGFTNECQENWCDVDTVVWDNLTVNISPGVPAGRYLVTDSNYTDQLVYIVVAANGSYTVDLSENGGRYWTVTPFNLPPNNVIDWSVGTPPGVGLEVSVDADSIVVDQALTCGYPTTLHASMTVNLGAPELPPDDDQTKECDESTDCEPCPMPMAAYSIHLLTVSLHIEDTPISYNSPRGPSTDFRVVYNHREANQPTTFAYSNFGPKWTFNWLSYVTDNGPSVASENPTVYVRGGGTETYGDFNSSTGEYAPNRQSLAVLVRVSGATYEKRFPDGSKEIFSESDAASSYPRRVFLSSVVDATGNATTLTYDTSFRITAITDSLEQVTTVEYKLKSDHFKITKVKDPFNRSATFSYTSGKLTKITDPIGIQSQFGYASGSDFINSMTTPYGTTTFAKGETGNAVRWLEATDPRGGKERVEYNDNVDLRSLEPADTYNYSMNRANTFHWDKKAMAVAPGDYTKAHIIHWLTSADGNTHTGIKHSEKRALENRVWYSYEDQIGAYEGRIGKPITIMRKLDEGPPYNGATQTTRFEYNALGKVTKETDPKGRVMSYDYHSNNIDLLTVRQTRGSNNELVRTLTYNSHHQPLTDTDAAGQVTHYDYNSQGQLLSITNARGEVTTYGYDRNQNNDGDTDGYLTSITSPAFETASAATTFAYDSAKRIHTVTTSPDNYVVTTDYDEIDRPTKITYSSSSNPSQTYQEFNYRDNVADVMTLDLTKSRDRLGRWTYKHYNANRQMDSMTDPLGQTTLYDWCACGALTSITDANGGLTTFNRDVRNRVTSKVFADASVTTYTYEDTTSRLKSTTNARGLTLSYKYEIDDNLKTISSSDLSVGVNCFYDPDYNRITTRGTTEYTYYPITSPPTVNDGKLESIDGPFDNDTIIFTYDELGRVATRSINGGTPASVSYDALGRVSTSVNDLGSFTRSYEGVTPRLSTLTFPNGQTSNYTYFINSGDRRLQILQHRTSGAANISRFEYGYDAEAQIQSWAKLLGGTASPQWFDYDDANQLLSARNASNPNSATLQYDYGYDLAGNRLSDSVSNPHLPVENGTVNGYTANALNQIDSVITMINGNPSGAERLLTYDADGNMTYDGGVKTFEWDAADRLIAINYVDTGNRTEFYYDGLDHRTAIVEYGPGVTATIQPNGSGYTTFTAGPVPLPSGSYTLTFMGLNLNGDSNMALIDSVKLNNALVPNGGFESPDVSSSPGGYEDDPSDSAWSFEPDAGIAANGSDFTLNNPSAPDGNQVAYVHDFGQLSQTWTVAAGTYTLSFKAAQRGSGNVTQQQLRVSLRPSGSVISTKTFVWCGNQICEERDETGTAVTKRFFAEGEQRIGGSDAGNYFYTRDHLGSIRELTDSSGVLKARYDYDPYGNPVVVSGNTNVDFGYTGHYFHQPSGLNLPMYRAYSPALGRWLSRDPIGERGGINLYEYVENNPIMLIDADGLIPLPPDRLGGNAIIGNVQQGIKKETGIDVSKNAARCLIKETSIPELSKMQSDDKAEQKKAGTDILNRVLSDKRVSESIKQELRKLLQ